MNFNASFNLMANIGELCTKTSGELKNKYPKVEWKKVSLLSFGSKQKKYLF